MNMYMLFDVLKQNTYALFCVMNKCMFIHTHLCECTGKKRNAYNKIYPDNSLNA